MKYWFIIDDERIGPLTPEEAAKLPLTPSTPVWSDGLPDWTTCSELPEMVRIMHPQVSPIANNAVHDSASAAPRAFDPAQPMPAFMADDECPPTHLGWCIASTLLFCLPLGVLGIIFSAQVKGAWRSGDYKRANKMSERAAWCVMLAITIGLVLMPFQMLKPLL